MNLYGFAGGDPVNFSDPFGLCPNPLAGGLASLQCLAEDFLAGGRMALANARDAFINHLKESAANSDPVSMTIGFAGGLRVVGGRAATNIFAQAGIEVEDHFLQRVAQREPRGITPQKALDAYNSGRLFFDPQSGNYIRHSSKTGISVVVDKPTGGTAITVFEGKPSPDWVPVRWRP